MRLFIAVELSAAAHALLRVAQRELDARLRHAGLARVLRWSATENLHLTLRFLGETSAAQRRAVEGALAALAPAHAPFELEATGLGAFPSFRRPSVLWAGVQGAPRDLAALHALQAPLEQAARATGFAAEERPFAPHLTLARFRREAQPAALSAAGALLHAAAADSLLSTQRAPFAVSELVLMRSDLQPAGPVYTPLARFPLAVAPPPT